MLKNKQDVSYENKYTEKAETRAREFDVQEFKGQGLEMLERESLMLYLNRL